MLCRMRLHLVDGTYELFRAHFSKRPEHRVKGQTFKATAGLLSSLLFLLQEEAEAVTHLAVAFDHPIRSFRNDLFPAYKSDEGVPDELRVQFGIAEEAVRALGLTVWPMAEFEADDALATAADRFGSATTQVRVLSPDKDLLQCVRGSEVVLVKRVQQQVVDEAQMRATWGIAPASIPDYLALVGDDADGIPGLTGFGAKGAAALLGTYGHLEQIPARSSDWKVKPRGAEVLAATLQENLEAAKLYRTLARLRTDVPLKETLDDLRFAGVPRAHFLKLCDRLELTSMKERPQRWA
jgi:5'-3' exonuclease